MNARTWTKTQVEDLLRTEQFRYQRIELPYGLATEGRDRSGTANRIFPADLTGKSVIDLGCSHGYFCFEAVRRGASRVVGYDVEADVIRKNRLLADILGADVAFGMRDIEREPLTEQFDYVLCLNVLHHLNNPLSVLDNLVDAARERLVLEMASFGGHDRRRLGLFPLFGQFLAQSPIIYVSKSGTSGKRQLKKFFVTRKAIRNLLEHHRHVYARVDIEPSDHKGRYIVLAHRPRIRHLVIVAGPSAVGKSTFCDRFLRGELPELYRRLEVDPTRQDVPFLSARDKPPKLDLEAGLFHYDILRPFMRSARVHARDEALDVLKNADKVTVLTLWTEPAALKRQLASSGFGKSLFRRPSKRERAIIGSYENPSDIVAHYEPWMEFVAATGAEHHVVDLSSETPRLLAPEVWTRHVERWRPRSGEQGVATSPTPQESC